ncbi:MAG TPA: hypothetical protein VFF30_12315 [Nitrososphaerales archaeon]|nr:hypothetical protein [Nitrososphaerales archaeon]
MREISDHPKAVLAIVIVIFFVTLALSLYLPSYYGTVETNSAPGAGTTVVVYWHGLYYHFSTNAVSSGNSTGLFYKPIPCVHRT